MKERKIMPLVLLLHRQVQFQRLRDLHLPSLGRGEELLDVVLARTAKKAQSIEATSSNDDI